MSGARKKVVVIGGGAAGFFAAINVVLNDPGFDVTILEKTGKLLSKVKISGGGRCNVTHRCFDNKELVKFYPRGHRELLQVFSRFAVEDTIQWFDKQGVKLKTEDDGRMFPVSDDSQTILDCFIDLADRLRITIKTHCDVHAITKSGDQFQVKTNHDLIAADYIVCANGGHNKTGGYDLVKNLGHKIISPVPSLFTLNMPDEPIRKLLQGVSVASAEVKIKGTKLSYTGPVLITHWGLSGPAVLKLSAFAAHELHEAAYNAEIVVNWIYPLNRTETVESLLNFQSENKKALPRKKSIQNLPKSLWDYLCGKSGLPDNRPWAEIGSKYIHALAENISQNSLKMNGKTTFKEEFVTCGGVDLKEIDFKTMESRIVPGVYFCGEVLNIDGITGGFNFQNAWSTAWICACAISR
jgi:predicted Rossmann fold flavoprotein